MLPDFGAVQAAAEIPIIVVLHPAGATATAAVHYIPLRKAGIVRKAGKKEWA